MGFSNKCASFCLGFVTLIFCAASLQCVAQNTAKSSDDVGRIALKVYVPRNEKSLPGAANDILKNRLDQIATKNGLGGSVANQRFILTSNVVELTKDVTATTPAIFIYNLEVTLFIGDGLEGTKFASCAVSLKGSGKSEEKAYLAALKNLKSTDSKYQDFINEGKTRIIEYYNSQCDFIVKAAEGKAARKEYDEAIFSLLAVPEVCKECFDKCTDISTVIYKEKMENECAQNIQAAKVEKTNNNWDMAASYLESILPDLSCYVDAQALLKEIEDHRCAEAIGKAQGAWATMDADKAGTWLAMVSADSKCAAEAMALGQQIQQKLKADDKREWAFKLKEQQDDVDITKARVKAARDVGVAYGNNQPKSITYNVSGWWY